MAYSVLRGYVGDPDSAPRMCSVIDIQQKLAEEPEWDPEQPDYQDRLLWVTCHNYYASGVAGARFAVSLALDSEFRDAVLSGDESKIPLVAQYTIPDFENIYWVKDKGRSPRVEHVDWLNSQMILQSASEAHVLRATKESLDSYVDSLVEKRGLQAYELMGKTMGIWEQNGTFQLTEETFPDYHLLKDMTFVEGVSFLFDYFSEKGLVSFDEHYDMFCARFFSNTYTDYGVNSEHPLRFEPAGEYV